MKNMNANYRRLIARFGRETRFEVKPVPVAPFRASEESGLEQLKARLLSEALGANWEPEKNTRVRRAANEVAALAWVSPYPLLVFPVLFEEKTEAALRHLERQQEIRHRSRGLMSV